MAKLQCRFCGWIGDDTELTVKYVRDPLEFDEVNPEASCPNCQSETLTEHSEQSRRVMLFLANCAKCGQDFEWVPYLINSTRSKGYKAVPVCPECHSSDYTLFKGEVKR